MHWRKVGERGVNWNEFCKSIADLPRRILWRYAQAGDLPGKNKLINRTALNKLVEANQKGKKKGFTYTHKPVEGSAKYVQENRKAIAEANEKGFIINLSSNNLAHADTLSDLGIAPVVTMLPKDAPTRGIKTPAGRRVVVCPAEWREDINCSNCELCAVPGRKSIVGFRAHGTAAKTVSLKAALPIVE